MSIRVTKNGRIEEQKQLLLAVELTLDRPAVRLTIDYLRRRKIFTIFSWNFIVVADRISKYI